VSPVAKSKCVAIELPWLSAKAHPAHGKLTGMSWVKDDWVLLEAK